jgi:hypothetical protein
MASGDIEVKKAVWFVRVERRTAASADTRRPWVGVRDRTILPERSQVTANQNGAMTMAGESG